MAAYTQSHLDADTTPMEGQMKAIFLVTFFTSKKLYDHGWLDRSEERPWGGHSFVPTTTPTTQPRDIVTCPRDFGPRIT
jgi:hypothetical protein